MANFEELKKIAEENAVELTDDMLDGVAGGYYSEQEWKSMTKEEQQMAVRQSMAIKIMATGDYCKYFDPDPAN